MSNQYKITEEQKKQLLQISAQTLPDNPSREGYSAEQIRGRLYKPYAALIDMINGVFGTAYTDVSDMQTALQNGDIFSRGFVGWNPTYTYGAGEVTFYPDIGTYGAFVKSVQAGNTNHAPYTNGAVNSAWWSEVVNFNTVTDDFFTEIKAVQTAAEAAQSAAETAQGKAEDAQAAAEEAESGAQTQAQAAASSATAAEESADAAESAKAAAQTAQNAAESAEGNAQAYAGQASGSASAASQSEINARAYMEQAKQYAQKEYQVVASFDDLPRPGDSAYIYLVPSGSGSSNDHYSEYLWISEANDYEFVGAINEVDLSGYAQTNGTYPNMTVGNASNAASAQTAVKATQDAAGNDIEATYAKQTGTYAGMTVGNATQAGSANDPSAVHFTAQTLTDEQKAQARTNIGAADAGTVATNTSDIADLESDVQKIIDGTTSVAEAAHADTADSATKATQDGGGNNIENTYATKDELTDGLAGKQPTGNYALQNGTYPDMTVGNATNATNAVNATKATQDGSGNNIVDTYTKKSAFNLSTAHISSFLSGVSGWGDIYLSGKLGICTFNISLSSRVNAWTDKYIFYWGAIPAMYRPATGTVFGFLSCESNDAWMQAGICTCDSAGVKISGQSHTIDSGKALVGTLVYIAQNSI